MLARPSASTQQSFNLLSMVSLPASVSMKDSLQGGIPARPARRLSHIPFEWLFPLGAALFQINAFAIIGYCLTIREDATDRRQSPPARHLMDVTWRIMRVDTEFRR